MATVSTIPGVKTALVTAFANATTTASHTGGQIPVTYAWPGPNADHEAIFFGRHPELADIRVDASHDIPTIKAGRKQRQESYNLELTAWVFRPELKAAEAETCETRAFVIAGLLEDVLAANPKPVASVLWIKIGGIDSTLFPYRTGWACELVITLSVEARLL